MYCFICLILTLLTKCGFSLLVLEPSSTSVTSTNESQTPNPQEKNQSDSQLRVVGGKNCTIKEYPFLVSIRTFKSATHFCGGSLVSRRYVLSAAHCFEKFPTKPHFIKVLVGSTYLESKKGQEIGVKEIIMHKDYDDKTAKNDIALLHLAKDVKKQSKSIGFVKLPRRSLPLDLSEVCDANSFMVAGWGDVRPHDVYEKPEEILASSQLQCVKIPYIPNKMCLKYSKIAYNDKIICALYPKGGRDACQGDSGGPLFCKGTQYGIISWGRGCAMPDSPGFYTRVDKYMDFIKDTINNYRSSGPVKSPKIIFRMFTWLYFIIMWLLS
ncbi:hypothetical protein WA026_003125 [Henosepilachna vigintioctopunctata]|uniref:trypsin n=1 Tax=Henosepilachna vigintioctopunctata TaxID=420089 RepID=A0AAW1TLE9_9CUCU